MGEIAEMIINGMLCEGCGVAIGDEVGYPRRCRDCSDCKPSDMGAKPPGTKVKCPECGKKVKKIGLPQHVKDVHNA